MSGLPASFHSLGLMRLPSGGIDIFLLHEGQRLVVAEIMAGTVEADIGDDVERQRLVIDLDAADIAVDRAQHVVVDEQALEAEAEQRGMHAGAFIEQIDAGHGRERGGDALFIAGLDVGQLRIAHAGRRADGEAVEMAHLRAGRGDQRLLARAARHGAGAQIGDEGPRPPDGDGALLDRIHIGEARETFGDRLDDGAGKSGRRRWRPPVPAESSSTGMPPRTAVSRQRQASSANFIGGTTKQFDCETKGRCPPFLLAARDIVEHLETLR